ncbi:hypothetical protein ACHWQZ_G003765 [Mnemiopsis leidyi]
MAGESRGNQSEGSGLRTRKTVESISGEFVYAIVALNLVVGITTIILNSIVCRFYRRRNRSTAALLYIYMTSWDVLMGISALVQAVYLFVGVMWDVTEHEELIRGIICGVYVLTGVTVRSSVFANTVLSVVRTINITQPFYRVRRQNVHILNWVFLAILLLVTALDVWLQVGSGRPKRSIVVLELHLIVNPSLGFILINSSKIALLERVGVSNSFFQIATLVALVCLAIQSKVLLCSPDRPIRQGTLAVSRPFTTKETTSTDQEFGEKGPRSKNVSIGDISTDQGSGENPSTNKATSIGELSSDSKPNQPVTLPKVKEVQESSSEMRTTMTIAQLTMVFCLCNLAYTVAVIWLADSVKRRRRNDEDEPTDRQIFYVTSTFVPFLNSMINPLILILRSKSVRNYIGRVFS